MAERGRFITLEGGEGAGKSTQARMLAERLRQSGLKVRLTREPGGTDGAERLRELLLSAETSWSPLAETLLHFAARADHVATLIRPALESGEWVVCDRFADSTMAYQGFAQSADRDQIRALTAMLGLAPDLTLILDIPPEVSRARLAGRGGGLDRYESMGSAFFARVREGFAAIATAEPMRCEVILADDAPELVAAKVWEAVTRRCEVP